MELPNAKCYRGHEHLMANFSFPFVYVDRTLTNSTQGKFAVISQRNTLRHDFLEISMLQAN